MRRVTVNSKGAARARDGHPWLYRADVADVAGDPGGVGDAVEMIDERGRSLGCALWAAPPAPIALRVYARNAILPFDEVWPARLARSVARREGRRLGRLVHAEADQLPGLFVDRYEDVGVLQSTTRAVDVREEAIARALRQLLDLRLVVARDDGSARDHEALPRRKGVIAGEGGTRVRAREGAAVLEIDVLEDHKTGTFLDQRENHARAGELARGECLDVFSHHGGFALQMAARAAHVTAIEEDPAAAARARENARASGLGNVNVVQADAFVELRRLESEGKRFDVVVLDPPAFGKRRGPLEAALRAYKELNLRAFRIAAEGGTLISCSCSGKVTPPLFEKMLVDAARDAGRAAILLERRGAASDHPVLLGVPETEYLKCWILQVM